MIWKPASRRRGFTFIELLVALSLLGFISLALVGGLRFGVRAWETGTQHAAQSSKVGLVQSLLRRQLSQPLVAVAGNLEVDSAFEGEAQKLVFVAPWLAQVGGGGATAFELSLVPSAEASALRLRWIAYNDEWDGTFSEDEEMQRILLDGLLAASFRYYGTGANEEQADWKEEWSEARQLPQLIAIEAHFPEEDDRYWPTLMVALQTSHRTR